MVPRYADSSDLGGAAFEAFVHHAMLAVAAGRCEVALITYASRQRTRRGRSLAPRGDADRGTDEQHSSRQDGGGGHTSSLLSTIGDSAGRSSRNNPRLWCGDGRRA